MKSFNPLIISGKEVLPLIEGGKGISVTNGYDAGSWAAAGAVGTFSGVFGDYYDENNKFVPLVFHAKTRQERSIELMEHSIKAAISQARIAYDTASNNGRIHMNVLWGISFIERTLHKVLEKSRGLIHGITCGAGMPYKMAEIAAQYEVYYYPIVSSARAFSLLWRRAYNKFSRWLGGVIYEDPWKAGGHNGISNNENPAIAEDPYNRVKSLRETMRDFNLHNVPIVMAGGVWFLREWQNWIDNSELGPICFQLGTRPLLTQESPISDTWKQKLLTIKDQEDVCINHFSPTGFYSSSVKNNFLNELQNRAARQVSYSLEPINQNQAEFVVNKIKNRVVYLTPEDYSKAIRWQQEGFNKSMSTPDKTLIFVSDELYQQIRSDQLNCAGCLKFCRFSAWIEEKQIKEASPDPRSYCIRKTLHDISHGGSVEDNLMFAGHSVHLFSKDPFYANGFIPTVKQLVARLLTGD